MKTLLACCLFLMLPLSAVAGQTEDDLARARAEITPMFEKMVVAANEHNPEKHMAYYVHDETLRFVVNADEIVGYDALLAKQHLWWSGDKTDVVYTLVGAPEFTMPAPGVVVLTYFLSSTRTREDGTTSNAKFGITALWQNRPEGWRIFYAHESVVPQ